MEKYEADGHLTVTTKLITADVTNLYTMIPRIGALEALMRFLEKYSKRGKIGTLSIDHIMKMARLVLDTNCFAYQNKYYKQIRGGAMGSAFTQVLANIYMLEWEHGLIEHQISHNELYGRYVQIIKQQVTFHIIIYFIFRYIDDIFMTTNLSTDAIQKELQKAQNKDINIKIDYKLDLCVDYLDVAVKNENGHLRTSIFHKPSAEPYILPYTSDHPHHMHRNIPYEALMRAAGLCSNVHDFDMERIRIDLALLLNDYPPDLFLNTFIAFFI